MWKVTEISVYLSATEFVFKSKYRNRDMIWQWHDIKLEYVPTSSKKNTYEKIVILAAEFGRKLTASEWKEHPLNDML